MRRIYLDLDGVMADFDKSFTDTFGVDHRNGMPKKEMWQYVHSKDSFFHDLPAIPGAMKAWDDWLYEYEPIILTACPSSAYEHVARQKREWVRRHLGKNVLVLPVNGSESKPLFMSNQGDILIDDWGKNIAAWEEAGGVGIKFENNWEDTRLELVRKYIWGKTVWEEAA